MSWLGSIAPYVKALLLRKALLPSQDCSQILRIGMSISDCTLCGEPCTGVLWTGCAFPPMIQFGFEFVQTAICTSCSCAFHFRAQSGVRLLHTSQGACFYFSNSLHFLIISILYVAQLRSSSSIAKQTCSFATAYR